jgi:hypothetical protein
VKVLCVTHSSRPFVEARASLNALEARFPADRLRELPPLDSLAGIEASAPYTGALTLWRVDDEAEHRLTFLREYNPGYKVQSASFYGEHLLVYGADRLEVLDTRLSLVKSIRDPWLCGGHTVFVDGEGVAWVTSAPANAIMRVDLASGTIIERIAIPEQYGVGYRLAPGEDLHAHFIPTDLQPTHVNCAFPTENGVLVTLCIQGAVGMFDAERGYREIVRGYRGCHGGKLDTLTGELYLTDSPAGLVWFFDSKTGAVTGRIGVDSSWLHDAHQISARTFVVGLSDKNEIRTVLKGSGEVSLALDCGAFGESVMFVNCCEVDARWQRELTPRQVPATPATKPDPMTLGEQLVPPLLDDWLWKVTGDNVSSVHANLVCEDGVAGEYLLSSDEFELNAGSYVFECEIACKKGGITVGLLESSSDQWLAPLTFDASNRSRWTRLDVRQILKARLVVAAHNPQRPMPLEAEVRRVSLRALTAAASEQGSAASTQSDTDGMSARRTASRLSMQEESANLRNEIVRRDELLQMTHKQLLATGEALSRYQRYASSRFIRALWHVEDRIRNLFSGYPR